jgi:hypothetical protein
MLTLLVGISVPADAEVLCANPSGSVFVRTQCKSNETQLDPVTFGFVSGSGTAGTIAKFTGATTLGDSSIFDTGSSVGIGTTTPVSTFEVNGAVAATACGMSVVDGTFLPDSVYMAARTRGLGAGMGLFTASEERITIDHEGNVGIGTISPVATLEVRGPDADQLRVGKEGAPSSYLNMWFGSSDGVLDTVGATNGLNFFMNGDAKMFLTNGGSVGIGTVNPQSKLEVSGGDIRVTGGSFIDDGMTLNVPDYVFHEGYVLMPLDQLREHIVREKRLPSMPSAEEIRQQGLNLSQFQMKLLQKIEELTLYTLAQQEMSQVQQAKIDALEARIRQLVQGQ